MNHWPAYFSEEIGSGLWVALQLLAVSAVTTAIWSVIVFAFRTSRFAVMSFIGKAYIEVFRGTPLVVQVLAIFAFLPSLGIVLEPFATAVLAVTLNVASYLARELSSGI